MNDSAPIYVFVIQHSEPKTHYFIHSSRNPSLEKACLDCEILYDFIESPKVLQVLPISHVLDVDVMVKKWMWKYGFQEVRGGSFNRKTLTDRELQILYEEYDNLEHSLLADGSAIDKLNLHHMPQELEDPYYLHFEEWELHKKYLEYKKAKERVVQFRKCEGTTYLGRHLLDDIAWLQNFIDCDYEEGEQLLPRTRYEYKRILMNLSNITKKYIGFGYSEKIPDDNRIFYEHPEFFLDSFFFHRKDIRDWGSKREAAHQNLKFFECMCYTMINRLEEMEFDLSEYPENFEKEYEVGMKYYQYWRNKSMIQLCECD
jgi:hypothetical protein